MTLSLTSGFYDPHQHCRLKKPYYLPLGAGAPEVIAALISKVEFVDLYGSRRVPIQKWCDACEEAQVVN